MDKKNINTVSSSLKTNFQVAQAAIEKNNSEYAIMLLKGLVQKEPGFTEARELLRKVERLHTDKLSFMARLFSGFKISAPIVTGKALMAAKKPLEAMKRAEDALAVNLSSLQGLFLLVQAAEALKAGFIVVETLEIACMYHPKNIMVLDALANAYAENKMGMQALKIRQEIASIMPDSLEAHQKVREAAALSTMDKNQWEDKSRDYRGLLKSQDESVEIEQKDRIVRALDDIKALIETYEKQRSGGRDSLDVKKKLADLYQKADKHDKAIEYYNMVIQEMGALDPFIDRGIERSRVAQYEMRIKEWTDYLDANSGKKDDAEKNISAINAEKYNYQLERAVDRVNTYPNDLQLRYELALLYWEGGDVENALHQFQLSQKNPQRRLSSIVYLGRCFNAKGQNDIAVEQFERAINEMLSMDNQKKEALYYLGVAYESIGDIEKALDCFKKIYQADIKYRDVGERINSFYEKK